MRPKLKHSGGRGPCVVCGKETVCEVIRDGQRWVAGATHAGMLYDDADLRAVLLEGGERARRVLDRIVAEEERAHRLKEESEERLRRLREGAPEHRDGWLLRRIEYGRASGW